MAAQKQGGFKMSLGGLKSKPRLKAAAPQKDHTPKKSRLGLLGDDETEDTNQKQEISGWDTSAGGAVDIRGAKEKTPPRVIPVEPNRDWRADMRRKQLEKAPHLQAKAKEEEEMAGKGEEMKFGLTILKKDGGAEEEGGEKEDGEPMEDVQDNLTEAQRLEKKALEALLNGKATDEHIIPVQADEEAAFRKDVDDAPEAPSLAAYEATPIEGFGAALLRGMGWKGEDSTTKINAATKTKEPKRRPALLGIGAKEEAAVGVELGEWSKKGKRGKGAIGYNPVALKNKKTGELITEEELKVKLESQDKLVEDESKNRKENRRDYSDDERREKRRDRRDDGYDSRDRRREKDDHHDSDRRQDKKKDKYRDDEYDSERRREKRRDRDEEYDSERRSEKKRDRDRDRRDRSRSPRDEKRDSRKERYRSRSRESKRRDRSRDADDRRERRRHRDYDEDRNDRKRR